MEAVNQNRRIALARLEDLLDASRITIQRDLVELEKLGLLRRFHGGAMSLDFSEELYDYNVRKNINVEKKRRIAQKASSKILPGSYVGMDASSTVYYISECLVPDDVFILTTGIDIFSNLARNSSLRPVLSGGRLNRKTNTLTGPETLNTIRSFRLDMAFISAVSYVPGLGFFDPYEDEVQAKRALIEVAERTVLLLDSTKIAGASGIKVCGSSEVDMLIMDEAGNKELREEFGDRIQ